MEFLEGHFPSSDKRSRVAYSVWSPEGEVRAILQISHGMCEYVGRYAEFAAFLTAHGIAVCGNDHLGHGRTAASDDELGYIPRGGADMLVEDLHTMSGIARERFPGVPLFLLGHSMGSFIMRLYLTKYGSELDGGIIMGTGGPGNPTALGKLLATLCSIGNGGHSRPKLIQSIAFGSYDKHFGGETVPNAWLSRNTENREKYAKDKYCSSFIFTAAGFHTLFDMIGRVSAKSWAAGLVKDTPLLVTSGEDDPVGGYGEGVREVYRRIVDAGVRDVTLTLYPDDRHEILNELDREQVYLDILSWLEKHI